MKLNHQCRQWLEEAKVVEVKQKSRNIVTATARSLAKKAVNRDQFQYAKVDGEHPPLIYAIRNGHRFLFDQLLQVLKVDPNLPDALGIFPLHHAAAVGQIEMIETLIETYLSDIEAGDFGHSTPLCLAIAHNQNAALHKLLGYGASTEAECFLGQPIHIAIHEGNIDALRVLHEKNPGAVNSELYGFWTPLIAASLYDSNDCFKYLIEVADVNANPLMYKVICHCDSEEKSLERIDILLNRGLNPNSYDAATLYEDPPIICAAKRGWKIVIEKLLDVTDEIPGVEWTVQGILLYVDSDLFKQRYGVHKERRVACLKEKLLAELKLKHYLTANLVCKALYLDMDREEWDRFQSLCSFLIAYGKESMFLDDCNADSIQALSLYSEDTFAGSQGLFGVRTRE